MNLSVKNNIVHQRVGKILKFTSRIKRSPPREWEGEELRSNEGVGLSHDRESRAKREEERAKRTGYIMCIPEFEAGPKCD